MPLLTAENFMFATEEGWISCTTNTLSDENCMFVATENALQTLFMPRLDVCCCTTVSISNVFFLQAQHGLDNDVQIFTTVQRNDLWHCCEPPYLSGPQNRWFLGYKMQLLVIEKQIELILLIRKTEGNRRYLAQTAYPCEPGTKEASKRDLQNIRWFIRQISDCGPVEKHPSQWISRCL